MPVYLQAVIRPVAGKREALLELIRNNVVPIMEAQGWRLEGCFANPPGDPDLIIDLWALDDMDHFRRAYAGFAAHPDYARIRPLLNTHVADEVLSFLDRRA